MQNTSQRPGVYSDYTVTSSFGKGVSAGTGAIAARGKGEAMDMQTFTSTAQLTQTEAYISGSPVMKAAELMFKNGVSKVYTISLGSDDTPPTKEQYAEAAHTLCRVQDIGVIATDCMEQEAVKEMMSHIKATLSGSTPKLLCTGADNVAAAKALAGALLSERCILCYPPCMANGIASRLYTAAAFAGQILTLQSPVYTLNWVGLEGVNCGEEMTEDEINSLILAGVTPFENKQGVTECIRAVTTCAGGDKPLRSINTVLIIDNVMRYIRENLEILLKDGRGRAMSPDSIASQTAVLLGNKQDEGLISEFEAPVVRASDGDPTVCTVLLGFRVSSVVSIIRMQATIRV